MTAHPTLMHLTSAFVLGVAFSAPAQATYSAAYNWNEAALEEIRRGKFGPPIAARALAVAHTCMYDAWVPYDSKALPATSPGVARRPASEASIANKSKAVSFAAYRCLSNLFPYDNGRLAALFRAQGFDPNDYSTDAATPQGIGNLAAAAVISARRFDGSNQYADFGTTMGYSDYTGFVPANPPMPFCLPQLPFQCAQTVVDPFRWQPLINDRGVLQTYIAPHWERVMPFALTSASQFDNHPAAAAGPKYLQSPQLFEADINQVLQVSAGLTPQQKLIVEYWADGPDSELPPGHWALFAQHVSRRDGHSIDKDVKMFFAMHNASFDAGIVGWHLKRKYTGVRPITAVRYFRQGQHVLAWGGPGRPTETIDGGKWSPYNPGSNLTPAFPGWVSGHAVFSSSSAAVLRAFTGSDTLNFTTVIPADFGRVEPGVPAVPTALSYATFTAAANDAAASRLLGGIHFSDDNSVGLVLGDAVGQQAWAKAQFLFDGGLASTTASAASSGFSSSLSWTHTVDNTSNRLLVVGVTSSDGNNGATSVTYAGLPLTRLGFQTGPNNDNRAEIWYRVAPPVGNYTVQVRMARMDDVVAGATTYSGVNAAAPFGTPRAARGNVQNACVTLANEAAPLVASVLVANADARAAAPISGQANRWGGVSGQSLLGLLSFADVLAVGGSGASTPVGNVCNRLDIGRNWAMLAVPLKPAFSVP
jgi:PAP2 superfamily